uniref:Uncharacterized protein n=1 Tax=Anguilla anguilla TaxID=7936 RepID=A0A0E9XU16_ANGAN
MISRSQCVYLLAVDRLVKTAVCVCLYTLHQEL